MGRISIIIPVYKFQQNSLYFVELIQSIKRNIDEVCEIIVINDYPNEKPIKAISDLFEDNGISDFLVYRENEKNLGQGLTRQIGASMAKGEYLHFIDQDDFISDGMYNEIESFDLILFNIYLLRDYRFNPYKSKALNILKSTSDFKDLWWFLFVGLAFSPGQYVIKKDLYMISGGFPDLANKGSDDFGLLFRLMVVKSKIKFRFSNNNFFIYRLHPNQNRNSLDIQKSVKEFFLTDNASELPKKLELIKWVRKKRILGRIVSKVLFVLLYKKMR